ncbi:MAG: hypothetical protein NT154_23885 [Verrucomicrobia bacterium]|nr:hypothetical protein [Verrucomicrobiota bacterium]
MAVVSKRSTSIEINLRDDPTFFMLGGITAEENDDLQQRANAAVARLFRRRIRHPAKLVADFRNALRHWGFIRVEAKVWCHGILFEAKVGRRLERRLRRSKYFTEKDRLYGFVTAAARRAGLDPRFEDVWVGRDGSRVEGHVNAVPSIEQGKALDKVIAPWVKSNRGRLKPA